MQYHSKKGGGGREIKYRIEMILVFYSNSKSHFQMWMMIIAGDVINHILTVFIFGGPATGFQALGICFTGQLIAL